MLSNILYICRDLGASRLTQVQQLQHVSMRRNLKTNSNSLVSHFRIYLNHKLFSTYLWNMYRKACTINVKPKNAAAHNAPNIKL